MVNWAIVVAVLIQAVAGRVSRLLGAILGFLITTGILLWGVMVYGAGGQIAFGPIPLPFSVFILACVVWYGFDVWELVVALRVREGRQEPEEQSAPESDWGQE